MPGATGASAGLSETSVAGLAGTGPAIRRRMPGRSSRPDAPREPSPEVPGHTRRSGWQTVRRFRCPRWGRSLPPSLAMLSPRPRPRHHRRMCGRWAGPAWAARCSRLPGPGRPGLSQYAARPAWRLTQAPEPVERATRHSPPRAPPGPPQWGTLRRGRVRRRCRPQMGLSDRGLPPGMPPITDSGQPGIVRSGGPPT